MKIAVVSDTHGDLGSWRLAWERHLGGADLILHAGDVLYHGPRNRLAGGYDGMGLAEELNLCPLPLLIACGNCDAEVDGAVLRQPLFLPGLIHRADWGNIFVHHGDRLNEEKIRQLADLYGLKMVVSGHTHLYGLQEIGGVLFLNPGSLSLPKDPSHTRSYAILEGKKVSLYSLEDGRVLAEAEL